MLIRYLKLVADFTPELLADIIQNTHLSSAHPFQSSIKMSKIQIYFLESKATCVT